MSPKQEQMIEGLVSVLIQAFQNCGYPHSPLYLDLDGQLVLEIRMPPTPPMDAIQELGTLEAARAFPSIEVIELAPELRGRGIFTQLVQGLAKTPGVRAVVVSNVANSEFARSLEAKCQISSSGWKRLEGFGLPSFAYWGHD